MKYLNDRNDDCDALFITSRQPYRRLGRRAVQREIGKIAKESGINKNVYCHRLRHSTATHLLDNGADITSIQSILGHSSIDTSLIYSKVSTINVQNQFSKFMG